MSKKDFKEGMIAGKKPFEEKLREIQKANIAALKKISCVQSNTTGEIIDIADNHDDLHKYNQN